MKEYLNTETIPGGDKTYLQYFTHNDAPLILEDELGSVTIDTKREYAVIYSLSERSTWSNWVSGASTATIVGAVIVLANPVGGIVGGAIVLVGGVGGFVAGFKFQERFLDWLYDNPGYYVSINLIPAEAEAIKTFGCDRLENIA